MLSKPLTIATLLCRNLSLVFWFYLEAARCLLLLSGGFGRVSALVLMGQRQGEHSEQGHAKLPNNTSQYRCGGPEVRNHAAQIRQKAEQTMYETVVQNRSTRFRAFGITPPRPGGGQVAVEDTPFAIVCLSSRTHHRQAQGQGSFSSTALHPLDRSTGTQQVEGPHLHPVHTQPHCLFRNDAPIAPGVYKLRVARLAARHPAALPARRRGRAIRWALSALASLAVAVAAVTNAKPEVQEGRHKALCGPRSTDAKLGQLVLRSSLSGTDSMHEVAVPNR